MINDIEFVGGGGGGGTGKTNKSGPKKEQMGQVVPTPVKEVIPAKPAPVQKETVAKETWNVKKPETASPPPQEVKKEVERAEKKQEETTNIIRRGVAADTKAGAGGFDFGEGSQGPAIGVGMGPGEGSGFAGFGSYLKVLRQRVWGEWSQSAVFGSNEMCIIGMTVDRSGDVSDIRVEKASNNPFYDNVALRAVRNASPLPALPSSFSGSSQRFRIQFRLIE
jgi:TonB family protein